MVSPVSRWPVHWQCLLPAADHSRSHNHPPGPPGSFLTPATCRGGPSAAASDPVFNPAPLLNPVNASQETQQQYRKQYGGGGDGEGGEEERKSPRATSSWVQLDSGRKSACSWDLGATNSNKTQSNISFACGGSDSHKLSWAPFKSSSAIVANWTTACVYNVQFPH